MYNTLLQAAVMSEYTELSAEDLRTAVPEPVRTDRPGADLLEQPLGDGFVLDTLLETVRSHYLTRAMREANGVKTRAADLLGYRNYQTLDNQLKRLGIEW